MNALPTVQLRLSCCLSRVTRILECFLGKSEIWIFIPHFKSWSILWKPSLIYPGEYNFVLLSTNILFPVFRTPNQDLVFRELLLIFCYLVEGHA